MALFRRATLDEREDVFADRAAAGRILAEMLGELCDLREPIVLAIPSGGVPVAVEIARARRWPLDVAVVSKITFPWNSEAGYGAVAFDGTVRLDDALVASAGLSDATVREGIARTKTKVARRMQRLRGGNGQPEVSGGTAILVDDGLASGATMELAIDAVRGCGAARVLVAVPTAHRGAVDRLAPRADAIVCANLRSKTPFAVASAYLRWSDVPEVVADEALRPFRAHDRPWASGT